MAKILLFLKKLAIPFIMAGSFLFYKFFPKVKQDNIIEETIEEVVQLQMGVDVDLSPETPELD
jgi:hypothetical protein